MVDAVPPANLSLIDSLTRLPTLSVEEDKEQVEGNLSTRDPDVEPCSEEWFPGKARAQVAYLRMLTSALVLLKTLLLH